MKVNTRLRWLIALVALAIVATACSSDGGDTDTTDGGTDATAAPDSGATGDPVKIGLIAQEEELIAFPEISIAAQAGEAYVNQELDGVAGAPIEVVVCTVGDTPESTVGCAQEFANDDEIKLVLMGTLNSPAGNEILTGVGKPVLSLSNDIPDIITEGVWAFDPGAVVLAAGLLKFSADNLGASTYTLLVPDDPFYTEIVVPLVDALGGVFGIAPADNAVTVPLEGDPTGPVTAAADQGADVLIAVADASQCVPIADAANSIGLTIPVVAADTCMTTDVISSGSLDGWYAISVCEAPVAPDLRSDSTFADIVNNYGGGDATLNSSFGCWSVANVIVAAEVLAEAGAADATSESIAAALNGYSSDDLPAYPAVSCPGPDPFVGACLRTATIVRMDGDKAAPETLVDIDVTQLSFLLEG
ncbi:MAG: ABC transporter substrate-binding protein [Acidimicrobiia bacterium]